MSDPILQLTDVARAFGGVRAVDGVSFAIPNGAVFGLIGPNGAGKTTVVNLITSYFTPDRGSITFDGRDILGAQPSKLAGLGIARTFQNLQLFDESSVLENVLIGRHLSFKGKRWQLGRVRRREEREQHDAARELVDRLGLSEVSDLEVFNLPYGFRRRVEVARALAIEPRMILLDEPTAGMTRTESDEMGELIREIRGDGVTVLLVDHNVRLVTEVCTQVAVMEWGQVIAEGGPEEIWENEMVRTAYLGKKAAGKAVGGEGDREVTDA